VREHEAAQRLAAEIEARRQELERELERRRTRDGRAPPERPRYPLICDGVSWENTDNYRILMCIIGNYCYSAIG